MTKKAKLPRRIRVIFWTHFLVTLSAHILAPIMLVSVLKIAFTWEQGFLNGGLMIGLAYCAMVWGVNHVTNPNGHCWLTAIEQFYRTQFGLKPCNKDFMPRFYAKCKEIWHKNFRHIPE